MVFSNDRSDGSVILSVAGELETCLHRRCRLFIDRLRKDLHGIESVSICSVIIERDGELVQRLYEHMLHHPVGNSRVL